LGDDAGAAGAVEQAVVSGRGVVFVCVWCLVGVELVVAVALARP
jgi:hypothetical protein